ncbi:MAG TPA: Rid family hydrolase, partial [Methylomirabilota bacterium]|nr:Rid family hydrolase [Methylomirabilota bacterium]
MEMQRHDVGPRLSQAVVHGNTVYLAGMIADDPLADVKGQTEQILKKIDRYLANMGHFGDMNAVWDAWVDPKNTP